MTTNKVSILEERMKNLIKTNSDDHNLIIKQVEEINEKLDKVFVTKSEFDPIKNVVYGMIGLILVAVAGALIRLVIIQ